MLQDVYVFRTLKIHVFTTTGDVKQLRNVMTGIDKNFEIYHEWSEQKELGTTVIADGVAKYEAKQPKTKVIANFIANSQNYKDTVNLPDICSEQDIKILLKKNIDWTEEQLNKTYKSIDKDCLVLKSVRVK